MAIFKKIISASLVCVMLLTLCSCISTSNSSTTEVSKDTEVVLPNEYRTIHNSSALTESGYVNEWLDLAFVPTEDMTVCSPEANEEKNQTALAANPNDYCITAMEYVYKSDSTSAATIKIKKLSDPSITILAAANNERDAYTASLTSDSDIIHTVWKEDHQMHFLLKEYLVFSRINYLSDGLYATETWDLYHIKNDYLIILSFTGISGECILDDFLSLFTTADGTYKNSALQPEYTPGNYDQSKKEYTSSWLNLSYRNDSIVSNRTPPKETILSTISANPNSYRITELQLVDEFDYWPITIEIQKIPDLTKTTQQLIAEEQASKSAQFASTPHTTQTWTKPVQILLVGEVYTAQKVTVNVSYSGGFYGEECWFLYRVIGDHLVIIRMMCGYLEGTLEHFDCDDMTELWSSDKFVPRKSDASIIAKLGLDNDN